MDAWSNILRTMWIKAFSDVIRNEAKSYELDDCTAVIDAHLYFYNLYEQSRLPFSFGCESNRFTIFVKEHLRYFREANIKCYFVFKGSTKDLEKKFEKKKVYTPDPNRFDDDFVLPIFAYDICKQVLDEMNFVYINCPLDAKDYCITLAKKFGCPVIGQDIEYAMSKASYIPYNEMLFDKQRNCFICVKFNLDIMLTKYGLSDDIFVLFIVLTDTDCFPENYFIKFFHDNYIPSNPYNRIISLLILLSQQSKVQALFNIFKYLNKDDRHKFMLMVRKISAYMNEKQDGIPAHLFLYGERTEILKNDPMWFEKGVLNKFIAKPYIDLYYYNVYKSTVNSCEGKNDYFLSTDIIIYAYNLLTNYTKDQFSLNHNTGEIITFVDTRTLQFPKPVYEANNSVFENGWDSIKDLGLFEHFLDGTMRGIELKYLEELPADAKLLMISLTYYTMKSPNETLDELYSILLSYIMFGIVFEDRDDVNLTKTDYKSAIDATEKYFQLNEDEIESISDNKLIYPLTEFEHCIEQMNYLNALCGFPYKPTVYSKTYNETFVYKIVHSLKTKDLDRDDFFVSNLELPSTVYSYLLNLSIIHERLIATIEN